MPALPPPPTRDPSGSFAWLDWWKKLQTYLTAAGQIPWASIDFTGSNIADIQTRNHNSLQSIQGGTAGEFNHLKNSDYTNVTNWLHNSLNGLQGGAPADYNHLTTAQVARVTNSIQSGQAAGGDLSGTYPNPTVAAVHATSGTLNGVVVGGVTPAAGSFTSLNSTSGALNANIGGTTPGTGAFTTVTASSTITPSQTNGLVGTTTNNNANAGSWGEYQTAQSLTLAITAGVTTNVTSVSLTAGDWDVSGTLQTNPAGTTTQSNFVAGISTTSGAFGSLGQSTQLPYAAAAGASIINTTPTTRLSLASTTTVFLVANVNYAVSTLTVSGIIRARRVR